MNVQPLEWSTVRVSGPDAAKYLDGQLSQELPLNGAEEWSLLLEPDGTTVSLVWWRGSSPTFELLVPKERADAVVARLARFLLRVKCEIVRSDEASDVPIGTLDDLAALRFPWANEMALGLLPHTFGSQFVAATVSFTKGCFTGQELVGRMDARGSSTPWRFVVARGPSVTEIDEVLKSSGPSGPQGVTTNLHQEGGARVFGIAHRTLLTRNDLANGVVIDEVV